jgi:hypothetical protein
VFSIEDPFDRFDNPARAVRCGPTKRAGEARRIANAFNEAAAAIRRFKQFGDSTTASSSSQRGIPEGVFASAGHVGVGADEGVGSFAPSAEAAAGQANDDEDLAGAVETADGELVADATAAECMNHGDEEEDRQQQQDGEPGEEEAAGDMTTLPLDLLVAANAAGHFLAPGAASRLGHKASSKAEAEAAQPGAATGAAAGVATSAVPAAHGAATARPNDVADKSVELTTSITSCSSGNSTHAAHLKAALSAGEGAEIQGKDTRGKERSEQQQQQQGRVRPPPWPTTQQEALCKCLVELFGPQLLWRLGCCSPTGGGDGAAPVNINMVGKVRAAEAATGNGKDLGAAGGSGGGGGAFSGSNDGVRLLEELFKPVWLKQFEGVVESSKWTEPSLGHWMLSTLAGRKPNQLQPKQAPQQQKQQQPAAQVKSSNVKSSNPAVRSSEKQQQQGLQGSSSLGRHGSAKHQQQQHENEGHGEEADGIAEAEGADAGPGPHAEANHIRNILNGVLRKLQIRAIRVLGLKHQAGPSAAGGNAAADSKRKFKLVLATTAVQQPQKHGLPEGFTLPGLDFEVLETKTVAFEVLTVMAAEWVIKEPMWRQMLAAKKRLQRLEEALEKYSELLAVQQQQLQLQQQQQQLRQHHNQPRQQQGQGQTASSSSSKAHPSGQHQLQQAQQQESRQEQQQRRGHRREHPGKQQQQQQAGRNETRLQGSRQEQSVAQQSSKPRRQHMKHPDV